jgi:hypothetical protein
MDFNVRIVFFLSLSDVRKRKKKKQKKATVGTLFEKKKFSSCNSSLSFIQKKIKDIYRNFVIDLLFSSSFGI